MPDDRCILDELAPVYLYVFVFLVVTHYLIIWFFSPAALPNRSLIKVSAPTFLLHIWVQRHTPLPYIRLGLHEVFL